MHPHFKWGLAVLLLIIVFFFVFRGGREEAVPRPKPEPAPAPSPVPAKEVTPSAAPSGEATPPLEDLSAGYLQGYGEEGADPRRDLALVKDVIEAFSYSVKVPDALPTAGNREIVRALQGENAYRIRFVTPGARFLNDDGELLDRWGTPLHFHFVEASDVAIRSAGPDRTMWTADDLGHGEFAGELQ